MFTNFTVKNFRGFTGLVLKDLARVNLISGKNNTGKTALLEAVQLHNIQTNGPLAVAINKQRGIEDPEKDFADVVGWFFYAKHPNHSPELASFDEKGINRTLSMNLLDEQTTRARFPEIAKSIDATLGDRRFPSTGLWLTLRYEQSGEQPRYSVTSKSSLAHGANGLASVGSRIPSSIPSNYLPSGGPSPEQDVEYFSELESAKRLGEILPALQLLEPRLQRLSLVSLAGKPILHGDIDGLPRLVPVPFMGEGMRRVLSIVLAIANAPGGVVLIDEVENGLHYSLQVDVWKAIGRAARDANVQIFATTHSWECIDAAHRAFKEAGPYELRYYRLDRRGEEISVKSLDERLLDAVEKTDLEVR
jgi:predicted ATPase